MQYRKNIDLNPFNSIGAILIMVLFFVGIFYLTKSILWILGVIAPVLLIATLVIDYNIVLNYIKWIVNMTKRNPLMGIGAGLLTVIGYPVVAGFLFIKAMLGRKLKSIQQEVENQRQGEYVDFEEIVDDEPTIIELPKIKEPQKQTRSNNTNSNYDQFFE